MIKWKEKVAKLRYSSSFDDNGRMSRELGQHLEHFEHSKLIWGQQFERLKANLSEGDGYFVLDGIILFLIVVEANLFGLKELNINIFYLSKYIIDILNILSELNNMGIVINLLESSQKNLRNRTNMFYLRFMNVIIISHCLPIIQYT